MKVKGFRIYVGGGLGPFPREAKLIEPFTPADLLLPTCEAVLRVFDRMGERKDRNRARIKFLVEKLGLEEFRTLLLAERKAVMATLSGEALERMTIAELEEEEPKIEASGKATAEEPGFSRWFKTNLFEQKQKGWYSVHLRCPLGDITVDQMRGMAGIARQYAGGRVRTTIAQNLLLRWVPARLLGSVYEGLKAIGLAEGGAERFVDITRCPGADTCNIAVTKSRGLAAEIDKLFHNGLGSQSDLEGINIKISGCPNSCGQHHIAALGFFGSAKNIGGHMVPHYQMMIGGGTAEGKAVFGRNLLKIPARRVPGAVKALMDYYQSEKKQGELFDAFLSRVGSEAVKSRLSSFTTLPEHEKDPDLYLDWGDEEEFKVKVGKGECAV